MTVDEFDKAWAEIQAQADKVSDALSMNWSQREMLKDRLVELQDKQKALLNEFRKELGK